MRKKRKIYSAVKSLRGGDYKCQDCPLPIVPKQKYYEWYMGGVAVRSHAHHGEKTPADIGTSTLRKTDGGRQSSGFTEEQKDCTVRALAIAVDIPYKDAHLYMAARGRREGHGVHSTPIYNGYNQGGKMLKPTKIGTKFVYDSVKDTYVKTYIGPHTVGQFLAQADPAKRYIVLVDGHVFAVVGGKMLDSAYNGMRRHVQQYWTVTPTMTIAKMFA